MLANSRSIAETAPNIRSKPIIENNTEILGKSPSLRHMSNVLLTEFPAFKPHNKNRWTGNFI